MIKALKSRRGEGYVDVVVIVLAVIMVLAVVMSVLPAFITKNNLDTFASEIMREAEMAGEVGTATTNRTLQLQEKMGIAPTVSWSTAGKVQLNGDITVTVTLTVDIGMFGGFGSFPITLTSVATGKSEVYHK